MPVLINIPPPPGMVLIPGGPFWMGSVNGGAEEQPVHQRDVPDFFLSQCLATNQQVNQYVEACRNQPFGLIGTLKDGSVALLARREDHRSLGAQREEDLGQEGTVSLLQAILLEVEQERTGIAPSQVVSTMVARVVPAKRRALLEGTTQPAVMVKWPEAQGYCQWAVEQMLIGGLLSRDRKWIGRLPMEDEWEKAARGSPVNLRKMMRQEKISPGDFVKWARDRYENFVVGGRLFTDSTGEEFRRLLRSEDCLIEGSCVHATPSGRLSHEEVWYDHEQTVEVTWGPENRFGLKQMSGNSYEWNGDWHDEEAYQKPPSLGHRRAVNGFLKTLRGGSFSHRNPDRMRVSARRGDHPKAAWDDHGIRVAVTVAT